MDESYEYIVIGSGAGGGPLAANLAARGFRVLLIEAGGDAEPFNYQVPCFHPQCSEDPEMSWNFFVHHYDKREDRDTKYREKQGGVLYPRAGTLGGCTAHNAMITLVPHDNDWEKIADLTKDESWRAKNMWQYFQRVERCLYRRPPKPGESNPTGHGFKGWLGTSKVDPLMAIGDMEVIKTVLSALHWAAWRFWYRGLIRRIIRFLATGDDPNDKRNKAAFQGVTTTIPLATACGKRNGTREFIKAVKTMFPDQLTIRINTLATKIVLDKDNRAVAVECREGSKLYRADPTTSKEKPSWIPKLYGCTREIILAGGAFNTPQLLMLSGIGPKEHLEDPKIGIKCLVNRPGVGSNLQDRYEVGVVSRMAEPFALLKDATFKAPKTGVPADPYFLEWMRGGGLYTSNGAVAALILKSRIAKAKDDPDLFIFALPGDFRGYEPDYSKKLEERKDRLTWAILKAHTLNDAGTVRLQTNDPFIPPSIRFHYFEEGSDKKERDLDAVLEAVKIVRGMNKGNKRIAEELWPGDGYQDDASLRKWIADNAWGHHASCSCPMGPEDDPKSVVDSRFRVIGTKGLRIVDASVFPHIPGFFIVMPIYMISEKAVDVILEDNLLPLNRGRDSEPSTLP